MAAAAALATPYAETIAKGVFLSQFEALETEAQLTDLALVQHWASDRDAPDLTELPDLVLAWLVVPRIASSKS